MQQQQCRKMQLQRGVTLETCTHRCASQQHRQRHCKGQQQQQCSEMQLQRVTRGHDLIAEPVGSTRSNAARVSLRLSAAKAAMPHLDA
jgi:hypothetical protein